MPRVTEPGGCDDAMGVAALRGDHASLRSLIGSGADVNRQVSARAKRRLLATKWQADHQRDDVELSISPLMLAAGSALGANVETVQLLLEHGADVTATASDGRTALRFAAGGLGAAEDGELGGDAARLTCLLAATGLAALQREEEVLLRESIVTGDAARVEVLLAHGVYPDALPADTVPAPSRAGWRMIADLFAAPLAWAARAGGEAVVRALLAAGADIRIVDRGERSLMFAAASAGAARVLVEAGLPVDLAHRRARTALLDAIEEGDVARVDALLAAGADPGATDPKGTPLLLRAAGSMVRDVVVLRALVSHGADPHAVSRDGWNALHAAIDVDGAEANEPECVREILGYLVELGVDLEQRDHHDVTPLDRLGRYGTSLEVQIMDQLMRDRASIRR
jgi:uncharacterized protein